MRLLRLLIALLLAVSSLGAANLVPDSSFELGARRGWLQVRSSGNNFIGNVGTIQSLLTNSATHGSYRMLVPGASTLQSRGIYLLAGQYVGTHSAKTYSGIQGPYFFGVQNRSEVGTGTTGLTNVNYTGTDARYTNFFTATSNGFYFFVFTHAQNIASVDAIQLEATTNATAWAPMATVECGLSTGSTNNMWFAGDSPTFTLNFWNEGSTVANRVRYEVFDTLSNTNLAAANLTISTPNGFSSATLSLPNRFGSHRITSRLATVNDSGDETVVCVYPFPSNIVATAANSTNEWLGGHPMASEFHSYQELRAGRKWARRLNPNARNTRIELVQTNYLPFSFEDELLTNTAGLFNSIGNLTGNDQQWPYWLVMTNTPGQTNTTNVLFPHIGMWDGMGLSNYAFTVVNRFKLWVDYWELWNEPFQSGPTGVGPPTAGTNLPINMQVATNYALVMRYLLAGATNADPRPIYIAGAGSYGNGDWHLEYWAALPASEKPWIHAISTHIPPQDQGSDPNDPFHADGAFTSAVGYHTNFIAPGIRPVWQTEAPVYGISTVKGLNAIWSAAYDVHAVYNTGEEQLRAKWSVAPISLGAQILSECLRDKGYCFQQWGYYNCSFFTDQAFTQPVLPYALDYNNNERAEMVLLSVAQFMVRGGVGVITNAPVWFYPHIMEIYALTNHAGLPVVVAWNADRTNRLVTLSNPNSVFDWYGNYLYTSNVVKVTRLPQYFTNGALSLATISNNWNTASVADIVDAVAPRVSFDIAPSGLWSGDTNAILIKWTGVDDTFTQWTNTLATLAGNATNVLFKWKLDDAAYNAYSQSNHVWLSHVPAGNHTIYVTAKDKNNNEAEYLYQFEPPPSIIHVSGTANIGTITVP